MGFLNVFSFYTRLFTYFDKNLLLKISASRILTFKNLLYPWTIDVNKAEILLESGEIGAIYQKIRIISLPKSQGIFQPGDAFEDAAFKLWFNIVTL
jgi:hypothetical protein